MLSWTEVLKQLNQTGPFIAENDRKARLLPEVFLRVKKGSRPIAPLGTVSGKENKAVFLPNPAEFRLFHDTFEIKIRRWIIVNVDIPDRLLLEMVGFNLVAYSLA